MSISQEQYSASVFRVSGLSSGVANGNIVKRFSYVGETSTCTLRFGIARSAVGGTSTLTGFAFNYIIQSGQLSMASASLQRYNVITNAAETSTVIPLNAPTPAYNLTTGVVINQPYSAVTTPTPDNTATGNAVSYLITITMVNATADTVIEFVSCDVFAIRPGIDSAPVPPDIGSMVTATTSPGADWLPAQGQVLSKAAYPELAELIGVTPAFNSITKTLSANIEYLDYNGVNLYVGGNSSSTKNIFVSTDGVSWDNINVQDPPISAVTSVAYCSGLGLWIIAGTTTDNGTVYTSVNGLIWNASVTPSSKGITKVAASPTIIVAGGTRTTTSDEIYTSTDGITWTGRILTASNSQSVATIYYSPGFGAGLPLFIIGMANGAIITSSDSITWTTRTSNISTSIRQITLGKVGASGTIIAVAASGRITQSIDNGLTWTARTTISVNYNGVAWNDAVSEFIAAGDTIVSISANGESWATLVHTITSKSLFYGDNLYVLVGSKRMIATSTDMESWTARMSNNTNIDINTGAYSGVTYIIAANGGVIESSPDAITWTSRTSNAASNNLTTAAWIGGSINLFVVCGANGVLVTSPDGANWTSRSSTVGLNAIKGIAFNGTTIVIVAAAGQIATSNDGINWTNRTSPTTNSLNSVAYNGSIFCAVGDTGSNVIVSNDGITWSAANPTGKCVVSSSINNISITSLGSTFFLVQDSKPGVFQSTDGITWIGYATPTGSNLRGITTVGSEIILTCSDNSILTSLNGTIWTPKSNSLLLLTYHQAIYTDKVICGTASGYTTTTTNNTIFNVIPPLTMSATAYSPELNRYVGVGSAGCIISSTNGTTFTYGGLSASRAVYTGICWSANLGMFVAVGQYSVIMTSNDGINWTHRLCTHNRFVNIQIPNFSDVICNNNGVLVAIADQGVIMRSTNGITWSQVNSGILNSFVDGTYNSVLNKFMIITTQELLTSTDGLTWSIVNLIGIGTPWIETLESNGYIIYSASGNIILSPDGISLLRKPPIDTYQGSLRKGSTYSAYDKAVIPGLTNYIKFTDGYTTYTDQIPSYRCTAMTYCPTTDKYLVVSGQNSAVGQISLLSRKYNPSTQFILPSLQNTYIRVSNT